MQSSYERDLLLYLSERVFLVFYIFGGAIAFEGRYYYHYFNMAAGGGISDLGL